MSDDRAARLKQRTIVGGSIALGTAVLLVLAAGPGGPWFVLGVTAVLAQCALAELWSMGLVSDPSERFVTRLGTIAPFLALAALLGLSGVARGDGYWSSTVIVLIAAPFATGFAHVMLTRDLRAIQRTKSAVLWIAGPLAGMVVVTEHLGGRALVALLVLSKIGDTAGYYVGSLMGQRHPFPNLSPGKTVAGCVASLGAGILFGVIFTAAGLFPSASYGLLSGVLAGALVNLAAQGGDLLESWVKRRAGVKDSGTRFGPSGGYLDLIDSLLLSVPVALLTWPLLFEWPGM